MRKKILSMSIAAIMTAFTSSGVMAFDTDGNAQILVQGSTVNAGYQGNILPSTNLANSHLPVQALNNLRLSTNGYGDALIFPIFNQANDWGTEIVVRNTDQNHAIVAKVAIYDGVDSKELLDFNIYLSAADVVRFKIENGNLISEDGSVLRQVPSPSSNSDDVYNSDFASSAHPFTRALTQERGYVVVYGMAQASNEGDPSAYEDLRYHKQHRRLFKRYREELDACRPGWRIGHKNAMSEGTYVRTQTGVAAPNQASNCNFISSSGIVNSVMNATRASFQAAMAATNLENAELEATRLDNEAATVAADPNATPAEKQAAQTAATNAQNAVLTAARNAANQANNAATAAEELAAAARESNNDATASAQRAAEEARSGATNANNATILANGATGLTSDQIATVIANVKSVAIAVSGASTRVASASTDAAPGNFFGDVDASLTGTVRLYNAENGPRDMILPATAIANFTDGNKIIYTEGEIAGLQDRRIRGEDSAGADIPWAMYNQVGIENDARAFLVSNISYSFAAESIANKLFITQPYKRTLIQLGNNDNYWQGTGFSFLYNVFNENEYMDRNAYTESPYNSGRKTFTNELESLANLEDGTEFENQNGFALLRFTNASGQNSSIPAIVTQMIGTTVGGVPQVNWVYSQTK